MKTKGFTKTEINFIKERNILMVCPNVTLKYSSERKRLVFLIGNMGANSDQFIDSEIAKKAPNILALARLKIKRQKESLLRRRQEALSDGILRCNKEIEQHCHWIGNKLTVKEFPEEKKPNQIGKLKG